MTGTVNPESSSKAPPLLAALSTLISMATVWLLLRQPGDLIPTRNVFRNYYPPDQLSYAGFVANARAGDLTLAEPFTQTGTSFYPSLWYRILGTIGRWFDIDVGSAWNFLGTLVVMATVAWIGYVAWRLTHLWWAPLTFGLVFALGPISAIITGQWAAPIGSHAILWGPYGAFYTLNGEVIGLCLGVSAMALTLLALNRNQPTSKVRNSLLLITAFSTGLLANIHTYAFFLATAVLVAFWAIYGLLSTSSRKPLMWSLALLTIVLISGTLLRSILGEFAVFIVLLSSAIPGALVIVRSHIKVAIMAILLFSLGAAPQVLLTFSGLLSRNEFLTYRVEQSSSLGVGVIPFLTLGSPILALFLFNALALHKRAPKSLTAILYAWMTAFVLLTFNNFWGFGQEPYRFWINGVFFGVAIMGITTPLAIKYLIVDPHRSMLTGVSAAIAVVLFVASLWNIGGFRLDVQNTGVIELDSPQLVGVASVSDSITDSTVLLSAEPCIDPRLIKIKSLKPVAFYNLGMAWPENREAIDLVLANAAQGILDVSALKSAGVTHLITDDSCPTDWSLAGQPGVLEINKQTYPTDSGLATLTLWKLFK